MPIQHSPFDRGLCGSCHDPHATNNKWNLVKSSETVCMGCHADVNGDMDGHDHPFNVKPKHRLVADLELSSSGRLECLSCHNPHASSVSHLLRTNKKFTCSGCHSDKTG
jgi:predicted CXXCH cytochrome family protein